MSAPDDEQFYGEEDEEEMLTERDLADDAQWKVIQKNTFTRWANEHLKTVQKTLTTLDTDLGDGLRLIALVEVLSGKKFKHVNKRPNFRTQKLENVTMVLQFLESDEGIRIVNIDSGDIVDCKLKLILGLIWTLILHYSISMPMWEGEEPTPSEGGPTPKQRLLNWINSKVPDLPVKNFTTDWNDGKAIGALVDAVAPGLCPDWEEWDPKKAKDNAKEALDAAEKWLGVPQLIKPEEMTNPKVDDLSMMTYLSQFPNAKLKPGAPLRPKQNAGRVRAYGPGLEPKGNRVGAPAKFTVETFSCGQGTLELMVLNPKGKPEPCESVFNNDRNLTYSCTYVPSMEGTYKVTVKFGGKEIHKSPFSVKVEAALGDATKVTAAGPGLEKTGVVVGKKTHFEIFTKEAGLGNIEVIIMDPAGHKDKVKPAIKSSGKDGVYLVEYTAVEQGLHSITINFSSQQIPKSPYGVNVAPAANAKAAYATGRGIQPKGVRVKDNADFKIFTKEAGQGEVMVKIVGPGGIDLKCTVKLSKTEEGVYECLYIPVKPGPYVITITFGGQPISKSPFRVDVGPFKESKIIAYGPGLEGGVANQPAVFTVETRGEIGALGFSIEGPSQAKIDCKDNGDGSADVTYWPTAPGEYAVHVLCNEEDIPKSPYMVPIRPATKEFDASKVIAKGPGLEKTGVIVETWAEFTVDTKKAGKATLHITCFDVDLKPIPVEVKDNKNGTFSCRYMSKRAVKHTITITYGGVSIPKSPFKVMVSSACKPGNVRVYGPGVEKGVKTLIKTHFKVDCKTAGPGDVAIALTDDKGKDVPVTTKDNGDGTFTVEYTPETPGTYTVVVYFGNKEIPSSPIKVKVESSIDLSKVKVTGLDTPIKVGENRPVQIVTSSTGKKDAPCRVQVTNPKGKTMELPTKPYREGYNTTFSPVEPGPHKVNVNFAGQEVPKSPFPVNVIQESPATKVSAYGPGLEGGIATKPATFTVDHKSAPAGKVACVVDGPKMDLKPKVEIKDNKNGTTDVTYYPRSPGDYKINVTYASKAIPKSPFTAKITEIPSTKVKAYGPGLEKGIANQPCKFTVDAKDSPVPGKVAVTVDGPVKPKVEVKDNPNHTTDVTYFPTVPGDYKVGVTFNNEPIPKAPFTAKITESPAAKVKAYGPGLEKGEPNKPAKFTVDAKEAPVPGKVAVTVDGPVKPKVELKDNPNRTTDVTYYPTVPGDYKVGVTFNNEPIPKAPFTAKITESPASKVKAYGPGLEKGAPNQPAKFTVDAKESPVPGKVAVTVDGPVKPKVEVKDNPNRTTDVTYYPTVPGDYKVGVTFNNEPIPKAPFTAKITESPASKVKAYGPGLESGAPKQPAKFTVDAKQAPVPGKVAVTVDGPVKPKVEVKDNPDRTTDVTYYPTVPGDYKVGVTFNNEPIPKAPFTAKITESPAAKVKAYGPGLEKGVANLPAKFTIDTREATAPGGLGVTIDGPAEAKIECVDNQDGTCDVTYYPVVPGDYQINVTYADEHINKSPFTAKVDVSPAAKVKAYGPGLEKGVAQTPALFTIDTQEATAPAALGVTIDGPSETKIECKDNQNGTYDVAYYPELPGDYQINVLYGDEHITKSPFTATIDKSPASKVKAYGPGLEKGVATEPAQFTIDTKETTAPGGLGVTVEGPIESKIECRDNQDGTCDVTYYPEVPGDYTVNVTYADEHIPKSPFTAKIEPSSVLDVSKVVAYGPGLEPTGVFIESPNEFTVDAKSVTPTGEGKVRAIVTSPSGMRTESPIKNKGDGTYEVMYTPYEQGPQQIDVMYEDVPIPQSPMTVNAVPGCDPTKVKAYGPGLERAITDETAEFTIDVKGAGQGGLALAIDGPAEAKINCTDNRDGTCNVEYTPTKQGEYDVTVKFADQHVPGSPFKVGVKNPVNPAKVKCYGPGVDAKEVKTGEPATFMVDTTEAGEAPLTVNCTDQSGAVRPAEVVPVAEGKFQATYFPVEEGKCKVDVKYANQEVPNSPFNMRVTPGIDASKVNVVGDGVKPTVPASMPVTFLIDCTQAGIAELDVVIQRPDGTFIRPMIQDNGDGTFTVQYTPEDLGEYSIHIKFGGKDVPNCPFKVKAEPTGHANKCKITDGLKSVIPVKEETVISVDASQAGTGKVTCRIRSQTGTEVPGTEIDIDIVENVDGTFSILFTPTFPGTYSINIKFGGESIPEGEYSIQVGEDLIQADTIDSVQAVQQQSAPGGLFNPVDLRVQVGPIFNFVSAHVKMPSEKKAYPNIEDNRDGTVTIRYQPTETGLHELHLNYNNQPIKGSPYLFHVDAVNSGYVTAYGPGLSHGVVSESTEFTIVTKDAGAGGLSLAIEGPSKTEIKCCDNDDGTCTVSYIPTAPGEYNITVKFADKHISGSPFTAKVQPGEPKKRAQIGRSSEVSLKVTETDIASLTASIRSPSGQEEPCILKRLPNGHLGISFTPRETGEHLVNVFRDNKHIENSPFKITVGESELGNASKVKVYGKGLEQGGANEVNEFTVDTRKAGYGGLSLSIEGPSKADIECHDNEDGTCRVTYKPTEPGTYIINIKFADEHVPGSPFSVKVFGEPSSRILEKITRHKEAADITHIGSQCELSLKIPGTSPFDMTASVTSPSGVTELCDVVSLDDSHYSIKFVPKEMGPHTVSVKHKDMHIPGSPFEFTVGPLTGGGAHKVHAAGPGLEKGEIGQPCDFNIYTREGGAGGLSIAVEGPSKAEIDFEDRKDGSCGVTYAVSEPGEYTVSVKFNDEHIADSPFRVPITPSIGDARKVSVSSFQQKGLAIGKPCAFVVNYNGARKGVLKARVTTPSGIEEECLVQEIDDGEYAVRFIPHENGPHMVDVTFDGCQIPESPFRIQVGTVHADPGMVQAFGDGLKTGKTGTVCKFFVNTVNAGSGALAVTVEGPSKVKLECKESEEGYEFTYTPTAPGDYFITIKYAGTHIVGSPYKAKIEGQGQVSVYQEQASVVIETVLKTSIMSKFAGLQSFQSDASKVTLEGNGLKKAFRGKQSTFTIDTSQGGNNILLIGMMGPKGPCDELIVKSSPNAPHQYKVTYTVKERGNYMLSIKWGDEHLPGSPYCVVCE